MRAGNLASAFFAPGEPPTDPAQLPRYIRDLELRVAACFELIAAGHLDVEHKVPAKPRDVDLRVADGVDWNPGGGKGLYAHSNGVWTLIKALP